MSNKDFKRHIAYEVLVFLALLALLTYITRLWPILLLVILGIFIATLRLLFLSNTKVEPAKPILALPPPSQPATEKDMQSMAYAIIVRRITQILQSKYPEVRWIWENPNAKDDIMIGNPVYVLLNKAGGYRRGRVVLRNLQVFDVVFEEEKPKGDQNPPVEPPKQDPIPPVSVDDEDDAPAENFGLIAFQWVEAHIMELNEKINEAIAQGLSSYIISAEELPVSESWEEICKELIRNDLQGASCCDEGIIIEFEQ